MAADVSTSHRVLTGYKDDLTVGTESVGSKSTALITRDLLGFGGGGSALIDSKNDQSQELDLDLHVPNGWEKRLDLKTGKVYLQRCNSTNSSCSDVTKYQTNQTVAKHQDLNFPASPKPLLNLFDESTLDLKLVSLTSSSSSNYQSVCTLDKVKFALERAEKEPIKKRTSPSSLWKSPLSPSYSSSSSSIKDSQEGCEIGEDKFESLVTAGCPGCLSYVLIMKHNPKCPRCNTLVPIMPASKKPRIDLNMSIIS